MPYTTPNTAWVAGDPALYTDFNRIEGNIAALKSPPADSFKLDSANYTTTSTSFVDVDSTNLSFTITTAGGDSVVEVHFHATVINATISQKVFFDVDVDGVRHGGDDGLIFVKQDASNDNYPLAFTRRIEGLSAGSHTFKLQWKVDGGTGTIFAGAGSAGTDIHGQFWAKEAN
jgi:hypothetical protein